MTAISGMSPQAISGASRRAPPTQRFSQLFQQMDTSHTGSVTQAQFTSAFQTLNPPSGLKAIGADAVWKQLDPNNTGSVSQASFVSGMKNLLAQSSQLNGATGASNTASHGGNQWNSPSATLADSLNSLLATMGKQG
ncbi:MAG: EF-hand domain-containing protein [Magnetococcales bacterium]|nr:EF-hand domain-containing protein [Magnetococcales bacterium]